MSSLHRRAFLSRSATVAIGAGLARVGLPAPARASTSDGLGLPAPGPYSSVYGRVGVPRGVCLTYTADTSSTRTMTWLTTGAVDPGTRVQFGVVPLYATEAEIRTGRFLEREVSGSSAMAPYGFGDQAQPDAGQPLDGEHEVRSTAPPSPACARVRPSDTALVLASTGRRFAPSLPPPDATRGFASRCSATTV